jgi:hypothetical protein
MVLWLLAVTACEWSINPFINTNLVYSHTYCVKIFIYLAMLFLFTETWSSRLEAGRKAEAVALYKEALLR